VAVVHHEPWADEAQAWLIARDLPFWKMLFHELRYEGTPGLWHAILWIATHTFHLPYQAIGWIGASFAITGTAVLLLLAPFPRPVRYLMAFSYNLIYQYAVIARPYVLLPLLVFLAAHSYKQLKEKPIHFACIQALLANLTIHGTILAFALAAQYAWEAYREGWISESESRRRHWIAMAIIGAAFLFAAIVVFPPHDVYGLAERNEFRGDVNPLTRALRALSSAVIDHRRLSVVILLLTGWWSFRCRQLPLFLSGVLGALAFHGLVYGARHHEGVILIALMLCAWLAWDSGRATAMERMVCTAICIAVFSVQVFWSGQILKNDYQLPYSGAKDAAQFLHSVSADKQSVWGANDYLLTAVSAYFDKPLFANFKAEEGQTFFHHAIRNSSPLLNPVEVMTAQPEWIVIPVWYIPPDFRLFQRMGYSEAHYSPGDLMYKYFFWHQQEYYIFHRKASPSHK